MSKSQSDFRDLGEPIEAARTTNEFEAEIFISKLKAHGIPAFIRYPAESGAAKTYCGRCNLTMRIMVPVTCLADAQSILEQVGAEQYDFSEAENTQTPDAQSSRAFWARFILYAIAILFVLLLIFSFSLSA